MVGFKNTAWLWGFCALFAAVPTYLNAQTAPSFSSTPQLSGTYSSHYQYSITTTDNEASPRAITLSAGTLPNGLSLTDNGDGSAVLEGFPQEAGLFSIELKVTETGSPFLENTQSFSLDIGKATLTVIADNQSMVYGAAIPTLTFEYSGFVNGDDANDLDLQPVISTSATATSGAGLYAITLSGASDANYDFDYVAADLSIGKASLQVEAEDKFMTYGEPIPTFTRSYIGFVHGDDAGDLNSSPMVSTTATNTSGAGLYNIIVAGGVDDNYSFTYEAGTLTIDQAVLQVIADDQTKIYGAPNPPLTFQYAGFVHDDDAGSLDTEPLITTIAGTGSSVGGYAIELSGGVAQNYSFDFVDGQLTVTRAVLLVTAENKMRVYGAVNPQLTVVYAGFVNGDDAGDLDVSPEAFTSASNTSNAGVYSIGVSGGADNNYTFQYNAGQLTIAKASLHAYVDNATKVFGQPNPDFPIKYTGFANGDNELVLDIQPNASTLAGLNSDVGNYAIAVSGGLDVNYDFTYTPATLSITKATAVIQITGLLQNVDGTPKPVTVNTTPAGLNFSILYNGSVTAPSAKGSYSIQVTIQETNYQGSQSATYVLNGAPVLLSTPSISMNEDSGIHQQNISTMVDDLEQSEASLQYEVVSIINESLLQQAAVSGFNLLLTPATNKYGNAAITIRITDAQGLFVETIIPVTINNIQDPPVFTSTPVTVGAQDVLYTYSIVASDVDLADVLTISSIVQLPSWLALTNHGNGTATLTGTPGAANIGVSGVAIQVSDDKGHIAQQFFNINVLEGQFPPEFTSAPVTIARENTIYTYTATTSDFNGGPVTYSAPTLPSWLTASSNGTGGFVLTGTPSLSNVYFENGSQDFPVVIRATDDTGLFKDQTFQIRVLYQNSPPTVTIPVAQISLDEDAATTDVTLTGITDGGEVGQVITITATPNPAGIVSASVVYQSPQNTALVHLQPILNATGTTTISIRVQDNGSPSKNFVIKTFDVTVNPVNDPPSILSAPTLRVNAGASYSYSVVAVDPDANDNLTFQFLAAPNWLSVINVNSREALVSGTAPMNGSDALIRIQVSDPAGTIYVQEFTLIVNKPPVLQSTSAETNEDVPLELAKNVFQNLIYDPNADAVISIKIVTLPRGQLIYNGQSLVVGSEILWSNLNHITYVPPLDYFGPDSFEWNASDGLLFANAAAQISLTVVTQNDAPQIRNIETVPITFSQGDPAVAISSQLTLVDVDDINLQRAVVTINESFNPATDELAYVKPAGETSSIVATFNNQIGELTLTGDATKSAYETALRNVRYKNTFLGQTNELTRQLSIQVFDLVTSSAVVNRNLSIIRVLPDIEIVKAFTPNGDGVNDTWDFKNLIAYAEIQIFVFDNSGRRVYDCSDSNCAWDGTYNGKELPIGEYLYTVDLENGRRKYHGTVTLLK